MFVEEEAARSLLVSVGLKSATEWSKGKIQSHLNKLPQLSGSIKQPTDKLEKALLSNIFQALEDGAVISLSTTKESPVSSEITVVEETANGEVIEEGKKKKKKKASGEAKPERAKAEKPKKESTKDAFGCRLGSAAAAINAAVTNQAQTIEEIAEAAGTTEQLARNHIRFWAKKNKHFRILNDGTGRVILRD